MSNDNNYRGNAAGLAQSIDKLVGLEDELTLDADGNKFDIGWPDLQLPPINLWSLPAAWKSSTVTARDLLAAVSTTLKQKPDGWPQGVEDVAKMIEKKAEDYAQAHGHDDMGALSFGSGHRGRDMQEYHSNLLELAEEVRGMLPAEDKPTYQRIDWNEISKRGLLMRINREIMHPLGLAVYRDPATGESGGALVAPDGAWDYQDADVPPNPHAQLFKFYEVTTTDELIAAQEKHIAKLQERVPPYRDPFPTSPRQG